MEEPFYEDLLALPRGRGLLAVDVSKKLSPPLRTLCGIVATDDELAMQEKASAMLKALAESLPTDQHAAVLVALGLHKDFEQPQYVQRIRAAAAMFKREERAVRRLVEESLRQLARRAAKAVGPQIHESPSGRSEPLWRTESLYAVMSLESPVPEVFEQRTVIALADGITKLDLAISVLPDVPGAQDRPARDLTVDVFRGGTLVEQAMQSSDRVGLMLRLPTVLNVGERHDICLRYRAQLQSPHYACTPLYPCGLFNVSVRFGKTRPSAVYLLDETFQADAQGKSAFGEEVSVDAAGEAKAIFRNLRPGFAHGLRWRWPN